MGAAAGIMGSGHGARDTRRGDRPMPSSPAYQPRRGRAAVHRTRGAQIGQAKTLGTPIHDGAPKPPRQRRLESPHLQRLGHVWRGCFSSSWWYARQAWAFESRRRRHTRQSVAGGHRVAWIPWLCLCFPLSLTLRVSLPRIVWFSEDPSTRLPLPEHPPVAGSTTVSRCVLGL